MNPSFQSHAEISAHCDRLGTRMNATLMRHDPCAPLRTVARTHTASIFCGKMFAVFDEKSWQRRAWFSDSDRTCGQKRARCEQVVSNSRISISSKSVTASSPKSAGIFCWEKVNIRVPRRPHFETAFATRLTVAKNNPLKISVERGNVSDASHFAAFALPAAAIL